ncbi:sigma-70 family RNA polymerase sigma factor [Actinomadura parmotrematis]|uniref:Sigma-70 family RNA polymerase sigma factor n=1 Tax=Actinomadura parmotrematis TaxID=2864039 RepID=A0ABS7FMA3_9ACTN|nr:sigma-70 family RNA polymerase sigma factor [Actinomadura parmotrematis]MBW8481360.1 sigma-70 family RNA polymerase sigma factor [Actinomadura parmotrematis]
MAGTAPGEGADGTGDGLRVVPAPHRRDPRGRAGRPPDALARLVGRVAKGDEDAFAELYDEVSGPVYGLVVRVLRDPAQSEEVAQEVLVELWRTASRFDPARGGAMAWAMTIAHRRAVDRVRSAQAATDREERAHRPDGPAFDEVTEQVEARLEAERVRRCLGGLTELQRESVTLAYYGGYTYREVAELLACSLGTVKTRMRDGLIRMRDCLGVNR